MSAYLFAVFGGVSILLITISATPLFSSLFAQFLIAGERSNEKALHDLYVVGVSARQVSAYVTMGMLVAVALVYLVVGNIIVALLCGLLVLLIPRVVFSKIRTQRLERFEELLPSALDQLSSSAKAGLSLGQAFEEVAATAPSPIAEEFGLIVQDNKLGTDLTDAIKSAGKRIGGKTFGLVISTLLVNIEKGGNLPEALATMSESLKEVWRLEQKLITASAEGRKSIMVIGLIPIFVFLMVMFLQPEIAETLTTTTPGILVMIAAGLLYVLGILWLKRILNSDI